MHEIGANNRKFEETDYKNLATKHKILMDFPLKLFKRLTRDYRSYAKKKQTQIENNHAK